MIIYNIFDASEKGDIVSIQSDFALSLYQGEAAIALAGAAPYLVNVDGMQEAAGSQNSPPHYGTYLACPLPIEEVRHHLRKFLMVALEDGRQMYFRFYDPSVLNTFLPTCSREQLARFFGPIQAFWTDADDGAARLRYTLDDDGELVTETLPLAGPSRTPPSGAKLQPGR